MGRSVYGQGLDRAQQAECQGDVLCDRTAERRFHAALIAEDRRGHVIGDRTQTHPHLGSLAPVDQYRELLLPSEQLMTYGLSRPLLFRPPRAHQSCTER
jgi:peptidoglycan/xylan/chitin deacetylase (PgdA/CDA1 family)